MRYETLSQGNNMYCKASKEDVWLQVYLQDVVEEVGEFCVSWAEIVNW
jgi:hypothetical protein